MGSPLVKRLCDFIDASPTAYHAVDSLATALEAGGAVRLDPAAAWRLEPGRAYFMVRSGSALIAFRPGLRPPEEEGFVIQGAHTDSPGLKLRLEKDLAAKGLERSPVEIYGGPIVSTWLDRPLSLAGRVSIRSGKGWENRLVNLHRPVAIVPNLAIHLNRDLNKGFEYNPHAHLPVLVGTSLPGQGDASKEARAEGASAVGRLVAKDLGLAYEDLLGADLYFVDAQRTCVFGPEEELINGYRLDDLSACHAILEAFLRSAPTAHGQVACFLDHEEIGSRSIQGADSSLMRDLLGRIASHQGASTEGFYRALARSFSISVDVAQAYHPSYADKFDEAYAPLLNGGPAVKVNANLRYATDSEGEARFRLFCREAGVPCQKFMSKADATPGSTIGPLSSAHTGIKTVDVGAPLLSMHSIRETMGSLDHEALTAALTVAFAVPPSPEGGAR